MASKDKKQITLEFNVTTSEFKKNIADLSDKISVLNNKLKLNAVELKNDSSNIDLLKNRSLLLTEKLEHQGVKTANLNRLLDQAKKLYGEDSNEVKKYTNAILKSSTEEARLKGYINDVNKKIEEQIKVIKESESNTKKLKNVINSQADGLKELKDKYIEVILTEGKNSATAKKLKEDMNKLNSELHNNISKLNSVESASDKFTSSLDELNDTSSKARDGFTIFKGVIANFATSIIQKGISAVKSFGSEIVGLGMNFQSAISKVKALSNATTEEMNLIEDKARELGSKTKFSASQVAEAFQYMALAGWEPQEMLNSMESVLNLAAAADMDLAKASDIVTDYLTAFNLTSKDSIKFTDQLAYAMSNSNTNVEQLGEAYKNVAATSTQLGYSLEDTTAALMVMADSGIKGGEAGTALSSIMTRLGNDVSGCRELLRKYGVEVYDSNGKVKSLSSILEGLKSKWKSLSDEQKSNLSYVVAGKTAQSELMTILGESTGSFNAYRQGLIDCDGAASQMAATMQDNLQGDVTTMKSKFEELGLSIYEKLNIPLRNSVNFINEKVVPVLKFMIDNLPIVGVAIGGITTAIIAQKVATTGLTGVTKLLTLAQSGLNAVLSMNPITAVILVITGLVVAFMTLWKKSEGFRNFWINLWSGIKSSCSKAIENVKNFFGNLANFFNEKVDYIKDKIESIKEGFVNLKNKVSDIIFAIVDVFKSIGVNIKETFQPVINVVLTFVNNVKTIFYNIYLIAAYIFTSVKDKIIDIYTNIRDFFVEKFESVKEFFLNAIQTIKDFFAPIGDFFGSLFESAKEKIKSVFGPVKEFFLDCVNNIKSVFSTIGTFFKEKFTEAYNNVKGAFAGIGDFFADKIKTIKEKMVSIGKSVGDAVGGAFKFVINGIIDKVEKIVNAPIKVINKLIGKIQTIIPSLKRLDEFSLPRLKTGMSYVPKDYFPAFLDEGERVLTKEQNAAFNRVGGLSGLINSQMNDVTETKFLTGDNRIYDYLERIANKNMSFYVDSEKLAEVTADNDDKISGEKIDLKNRGLEL